MTESRALTRKQSVIIGLCALCLTFVLLMTAGQSGSVRGRKLSQEIAWLPFRLVNGYSGGDFNDTNRRDNSWRKNLRPTTSTGLRFDPFNELAAMLVPSSKSGNSTGWKRFQMVYPQLYRHLTKLTESPAAVAPNLLNAPNNTANNLSACRRPPDKNLAHLLNQPTSSFPFARPTYRGGFWSPRSCWPPLSKTAVLVPYRNRSENLDKFVPYMQTLLQQQNIAYGIFVIEQANTKLFNRAKLLNVGFRVAQQFAKFDCFVLHDADKVPENVGNIYDCVRSPKLMISAMRQEGDATQKYHRGRMYNNFLGGSAAISKQAFERVNGNSNRYYGWGREDDELASRLGLRGMRIFYPRGHVARFVNLKHSSDVITNTMPWPHWSRVRAVMNKDGLNSLNYTDKGIYLHNLFVLIRADL